MVDGLSLNVVAGWLFAWMCFGVVAGGINSLDISSSPSSCSSGTRSTKTTEAVLCGLGLVFGGAGFLGVARAQGFEARQREEIGNVCRKEAEKGEGMAVGGERR